MSNMSNTPNIEQSLITLIGAKGGVGTTTLALNMAAQRAAMTSCCLLDLDFTRGDISGFLDLQPRNFITEILGRPMDEALLRGCALHHNCGLDILIQPQELGKLVTPRPDNLRQLLSACQEVWPQLIVDCGSQVNEASLTTILASKMVFIVITPDILALRNAIRMRELLTKLEVPTDRLHLLLNRTQERMFIPQEEIEGLLKQKIFASIREDKAVCESSLYEGKLLQEKQNRGMITDIAAIWPRLGHSPPPETRKWWQSLLGGRG